MHVKNYFDISLTRNWSNYFCGNSLHIFITVAVKQLCSLFSLTSLMLSKYRSSFQLFILFCFLFSFFISCTQSKKIQWNKFLTSVHMLAAALPFDLFTEHPTFCCRLPLWCLGDVWQPEFIGHSDDSTHLAASLLSAHQNKHRRFCSCPPTTPPVQLRLSLRD